MTGLEGREYPAAGRGKEGRAPDPAGARRATPRVCGRIQNSTRGEKKLSTRRAIYRGKVVQLGIEEVALPDGGRLALEVVRHPGGAAVVALGEDGRVCLLRQYRHAAGGWIWEVPAGKLDPGEAPLETARRELQEEAGVQASSWSKLGSMLPTPGFCDEVIHLYLARGLETVPAAPGEHELLEVHWVPLADAVARARSGELRDGKTVVGLLRAAAILEGAA